MSLSSLPSAKTMLSPTAQMSHIPVVGQPLSSIVGAIPRATTTVLSKINSSYTSGLQHVPVIGGALAAPSKAAGSLIKSFGSLF